MENIYLIIVIILFVLAISDLIVGVSNDAVNFLNSAIGSKVASFRVIMIIAALGIFVGATYSTGMMEIARKGIFHPELFTFKEIMVLFMAVMIANILLLDIFNTFGMPTSTTVSIVFGLLGAAVGVAWLKVHINPEANQELASYINSAKALQIIAGILLSVIVAFTVGAIVQWLSRLLFSFNYIKRFKYFGAIWGGIAITSITYFILVKGLKGSPYSSHIMENGMQLKDWVQHYGLEIIGVSLVIWIIILQIFQFLKISILKFIVLVGTFALALAFAGNDLVNFIGVPLAGFNAYGYWLQSGGADPSNFLMTQLNGKVPTELYILVAASLIMIITLWTSKKARNVIKTELDLSRQDEGDERFGSSLMARNIVRATVNTAKFTKKILPKSVKKVIEKQFDTSYFVQKQANEKNPPAYDMIRASVNLVVASILIAIGTSFKLPLSTTYVTFMVAMGTSLADRAWSKESAVFRITGVVSVIGGWFLTAIIAFITSFLIALFIFYTEIIGVFILIAFIIFLVFKNYKSFKKKAKAKEEEINKVENIKDENIVIVSKNNVIENLTLVKNLYSDIIKNLTEDERKKIKTNIKDVKILNEQVKYLKDHIYKVIEKLKSDPVDTSHYYVQVLDYLRETAHCLTYIAKPSFEHLDNNYPELIDIQKEELNHIRIEIIKFYNSLIDVIENCRFEDVDNLITMKDELVKEIEKYRKNQIRRVKKELVGTRNSMLFLGLLHETKNLLLHSINLLKSHRDFIIYRKNR